MKDFDKKLYPNEAVSMYYIRRDPYDQDSYFTLDELYKEPGRGAAAQFQALAYQSTKAQEILKDRCRKLEKELQVLQKKYDELFEETREC